MAKFQCNFISYTLMRAIDITVVIPSVTIPEAACLPKSPFPNLLPEGTPPPVVKHQKEHLYPVLYLLHGYGNNHATWIGYTNVELYAEERNIAVVMISGENKSYSDVGFVDRFFEFIEEELPDFVRGMFPISNRREDTFIAGLSMGGFGSVLHGLSHPEKYAAIGAFSAALHIDAGKMGGHAEKSAFPDQKPIEMISRLRKESKAFPALYLACGDRDPLLDNNIKFKDTLLENGIEHTWVVVEGFGHEWRFWNQQIEAFLDWVPRSDSYAAENRRHI